MGQVGNRIHLSIERPPRELVEKFREARTPDLTDAMNRSGGMREIYPTYTPIPKCVGPAITVKVQPGDALMVQKAVSIAEPGDVIVIDGRGLISRSVWGGVRSAFAAYKGIAGVIIDGATRDVDETKAAGLPIFARAITTMGSVWSSTGEINYPVACGGVVVNPGDIVVADDRGIVVIPRQDAEDVYNAWRKIVDYETMHSDAQVGRQNGADEVEQLLIKLGCEVTP